MENTGCSSESSRGWSRGRAVPFLIHSNMSFSSRSKSLSTTSPTFTSKSTAARTGGQLRTQVSEATRGGTAPQAAQEPHLPSCHCLPGVSRSLFKLAYLPSGQSGCPGLETWPSHEEHSLVLQGTQAWFPAPTLQAAHTVCSSSPRGPDTPCWPLWVPGRHQHVRDTQIYMQVNTHKCKQ